MTYSLLVSCLLVSATPANGVNDPGQRGPFAVGFTSYTVTDLSRPGDGGRYPNRPIPVHVWYPADPEAIGPSAPQAVYPLDPLYGQIADSYSSDWEKYGIDRAFQGPAPSASRPFPLLVFSPGWGIPAWMHTSIGARLASHGFVVAVPYHYGDQWWAWEQPYDALTVATYNRPLDVSLVLTDLVEKSRTSGHLLQGTIRPDQVAAGGWSLGGYAAMVLAGGDDDVCDTPFGPLYEWAGETLPPGNWCVPAHPDPRFKAIVPLDGSGWILHFRELSRITVPAMGMGQEWGRLMAIMGPPWESWQARQHAAYSGHPAYRVDVFNTIHQSFSDFCEANQVLDDLVKGGRLPGGVWPPGLVAFLDQLFCTGVTPSGQVHRLVNQYEVAFLKTNLAGVPGYQDLLTPGWALTREPLIEFFVTEKRNPSAISADWPGDFLYFPHQPGSEQARAAKDPKPARAVQRALEFH